MITSDQKATDAADLHLMQNIVIIESGSVLEDGVAMILREEQEFNVAGVPYRDDASLTAELANLHPDVIVLDEDGPVSSAHIFDLLAAWSVLISIRIVVIRAEDNWIDVYDRRHIFVTEVSDLKGLLRH